MHNNNVYYLRAITAEKELEIAMSKGRELYQENRRLTRDHVYALKVIEGMGTTLESRRHRLASWLGRVIHAPEMSPGALAAMLLGIRTALDGLPEPSVVPEPTPSEVQAPGPRVIGVHDA